MEEAELIPKRKAGRAQTDLTQAKPKADLGPEFKRDAERRKSAPGLQESRHRDESITVDPEVLAQMHLMHEEMEQAKQNSSSFCTVCFPESPIVTSEAFAKAWGPNGSWLVTAKLPSPKEKPHSIRTMDVMPVGQSRDVLDEWGVGAINAKGCKGPRDDDIGQDNFSVARLGNGWEAICVMDGHGPGGHWPSARGCTTMPFVLQSDSCTQMLRNNQVEAALRLAFQNTEIDLVARADADGVDLYCCGTTALCVLRNPEECPGKVWAATVGDSRCILVAPGKGVIAETVDQKPLDPEERQRLEKMGCEVKSTHHSSGFVETRIFVKGQEFPGLCMSRSLGDLVVKDRGVTWEPVVVEWQTPPGSILLGASDGVWEFMQSQEVADTLQRLIDAGKQNRAILTELHRMSRKLWEQHEGAFYCDDITVVMMPMDIGPAPLCEVQAEVGQEVACNTCAIL